GVEARRQRRANDVQLRYARTRRVRRRRRRQRHRRSTPELQRSTGRERPRRAGLLPGSSGITDEHERDANGKIVRRSITGSTRALDGTMITQTRTIRWEYDAYGRVITHRQPADDGTNLDRRTYT